MHVLLGLAIVLMATIPVLVPLAFTGGNTADPTEVVRLAAGPGVPGAPEGAPAPATSTTTEAAPPGAGRLHATTPTTPTPTPAATTPAAAPSPPPAPAPTTTDATTTAPSPDPTTPDPTAGAKVFAAEPNLVVDAVSWDPSAPGAGQPLVFTAVVRNAGPVATPQEIYGVTFSVDGTEVSWSDADSTPLAPGEQRTYTADAGVAGPTWTATTGTHTLQAWTDDTDRIPESNESDNTLTAQLVVP
jgi:hypothetical protein